MRGAKAPSLEPLVSMNPPLVSPSSSLSPSRLTISSSSSEVSGLSAEPLVSMNPLLEGKRFEEKEKVPELTF